MTSHSLYDAGVICDLGARLRSRTAAVGFVYGMLGGLLGAASAVVVGLRIGVAPSQYAMLLAMLAGVVVGFFSGLVVGVEKVRAVTVQTQSLLCQLQVARNTATILHLLRDASPAPQAVTHETSTARYQDLEGLCASMFRGAVDLPPDGTSLDDR